MKALIDKPLDEIELGHIRLAMAKVKCPCKLDISVFYQLTKRLPHEGLDYDDERFLIHFYNTFCNKSIKLLGKTVRYRTNVLYHLLAKIGKEPNADQIVLESFMKFKSNSTGGRGGEGELIHLVFLPTPQLIKCIMAHFSDSADKVERNL